MNSIIKLCDDILVKLDQGEYKLKVGEETFSNQVKFIFPYKKKIVVYVRDSGFTRGCHVRMKVKSGLFSYEHFSDIDLPDDFTSTFSKLVRDHSEENRKRRNTKENLRKELAIADIMR